MANWITVADTQVLLLDTEKSVMDGLSLQQTLQQCVDSAANFARGYIPPPKEAAPAVPPEVVDDVVAIARVSYLSQEPSGTLLTKVRTDERDNALAHLRDVARKIITVTAPDVIVDNVQHGPFIETVQEGDTGNSRTDLQRL